MGVKAEVNSLSSWELKGTIVKERGVILSTINGLTFVLRIALNSHFNFTFNFLYSLSHHFLSLNNIHALGGWQTVETAAHQVIDGSVLRCRCLTLN